LLKKPTLGSVFGMDESGRGSVKRFFGAHAEGYAKSESHAHGPDLAALVDGLKPRPTDLALDAATGTGFTAAALAPLVRHVTGIDVTAEMLDEAKKLVSSEGITNVDFQTGDAQAMKFADSTFDIVTVRRATHHFQDVSKFLGEAKRVLRVGGRLGVVDMSPPEGAERFSNEIEILRDSSHVRAFTPSEWKSMVSDCGLQMASAQVLGEKIPFQKWLYPVEPGGPEEAAIRHAWSHASQDVRRLLRADINGVTINGWTKSRIVLVAVKR
jgi:ubiquinone/menaquinone biosynthesis C-methylase UbiE